MPLSGPIVNATRAKLPITWDALAGDSRYGEALLQHAIDLSKEKVFGTVSPVNTEDTYPLRVIDFTAKVAAVSLIPAGVDFWMNQEISLNTTGTSEVVTYTDRAQKLDELRDDLLAEIKAEEAGVLDLIGRPAMKRHEIPGIDTPSDDVLLTPSPRVFPAPYRTDQTRQRLT